MGGPTPKTKQTRTPTSTHVPVLNLASVHAWGRKWSWDLRLGLALLLLQGSAIVGRAAFVASHAPSAIAPARWAGKCRFPGPRSLCPLRALNLR
eukprot:973419-Alexandrium_andersonii.AAC.1